MKKVIPNFSDYIAYDDGRIYSTKSGHFLKGEVSKRHYKTKTSKSERRVTLCKNGKTYRYMWHRVIAGTFLGSCAGKEVNHKDGNPLNNALDNLEIVTREDNNAHAVEQGLKARGERQHLCKNKEKSVSIAIDMILQGYKQQAISKATGLSISAVKDVRRCKSWRWLSKGRLW